MIERTEWEGLWCQKTGIYAGKTIKKADIPAYSRLIIKVNRYYKKDTNRPKFVFCFANADAEHAITMTKTTETLQTEKELRERIAELEEQIESMYTYDQVQYAINKAAEDGARGYGWGDNLVSDYL